MGRKQDAITHLKLHLNHEHKMSIEEVMRELRRLGTKRMRVDEIVMILAEHRREHDTNRTKVQQLQDHLRSEHRIKNTVDYAMIITSAYVRVCCNHVWMDDIMEHCREFGIKLRSIHTYDDRP